MKNNPFCLNFGKEPDRFVERIDAYATIKDNLTSDSPASNSYLIMGVRGSGKTVLLATIANEFRENTDWVVISLNPARDLLQMVASGLYENANLQSYFLEANLNLSKFGIGLNIEKNPPISDIQIAIEKMVKIVASQGKRILFTVDDITKSNNLIAFSSAYQDLIMKNYPVFLIMTGLYENVYSIQTDKRCSFLLRTERVMLRPLSKIGMKNQYKQTFMLSDEEALELAGITKGYPYAFQVLGYILWDRECSLAEALPYFDERMADYCYCKIWEDLSDKERQLVTIIAEKGISTAKELNDLMGGAKSYSVYRDRLIKKGILDGRERGVVSLALPRFEYYIQTVE